MTAIDEEMDGARAEMVREIERTTRSLGREIGSGEISPRVLVAMAAVPRHLFVPPEHLSEAYLNRPLPIGYGQTISQPFIVALMSDLARIGPSDTVLEIGTGSGYQGAVLARLAGSVYTIETIEPLAERAQKTFADLGLTNISTRTGDGRLGWPEAAPFDAIIVTAAPEHIPDALLAQLKPGGRLVTPVGGGAQQLIVVEKRDNQSTILREIIPVCFVPLTRPKAPS